MKNKRSKVQLQHSKILSNNSSTDSSSPSTSATSTVFSSWAFHINGHTTPPLAELTRLILLNGGKVLPYLDGKNLTTHIVAGSLTTKKIVEFKDYKVVLTEFVLDSIREGRLLDWKAYRIGRGLPGGMGEGDGDRLVKQGLKAILFLQSDSNLMCSNSFLLFQTLSWWVGEFSQSFFPSSHPSSLASAGILDFFSFIAPSLSCQYTTINWYLFEYVISTAFESLSGLFRPYDFTRITQRLPLVSP